MCMFLSFGKNISAFHRKYFSEHPVFTTFSNKFPVSCLIFQINANFLINQIQKYFRTKHLTPFLHFRKEVTLFIVEVFRNISFFTTF